MISTLQMYKYTFFQRIEYFRRITISALHQQENELHPYKNHKEGSNQRLKRDEAIERNHVMKAIAADILYLLQNFGGQYGPSAWSRTSTTLAVEHAAPRVRIDRICGEIYTLKTQLMTQLIIMRRIHGCMYLYQNGVYSYPISYNNDQQYSRLTKGAFNKNRVTINHCQCETPWYNQTHYCDQVAAM